MGFLWEFFAVVMIITFIAASMVVYTFAMSDRLPEVRPSTYLNALHGTDKKHPVVILAGDSHTQGTVGVGFYNLLRLKYQNSGIDLINAGVNGDFAWNLLQRLDEIILCNPDVVFILIGTNDALLHLSIHHVGIAQRRKHLPQKSTHDWFRTIYQELVLRLREKTSAQIVMMTLPPIGEVFGSREIQVSTEYSRTIEGLGDELGVDLIHIHKPMLEYLREHPSHPTSEAKDAIRAMVVGMMRHFLFRKSWDSIAEDTGQELHVDHIHLNSRGAHMIAGIIEEYLAGLGYQE